MRHIHLFRMIRDTRSINGRWRKGVCRCGYAVVMFGDGRFRRVRL